MTVRLTVERLGGIAGFGVPGSAIRSRGEIEVDDLAEHDRRAVDSLFARASPVPRPDAAKSPMRDGFRYRISRSIGSRTDAVEVAESDVPAALVGCVRDELA